MRSAGLYQENRLLLGQRALRRLTGSLSARVLPRLPKRRPDAEQRRGREPSAPYPARPLPGFSPASAEEVAEESVRTLGSL